jgi:hypothetical protein
MLGIIAITFKPPCYSLMKTTTTTQKKSHQSPGQTNALVCNKKECYRNYDIDCCQHRPFKPITPPIVDYKV